MTPQKLELQFGMGGWAVGSGEYTHDHNKKYHNVMWNNEKFSSRDLHLVRNLTFQHFDYYSLTQLSLRRATASSPNVSKSSLSPSKVVKESTIPSPQEQLRYCLCARVHMKVHRIVYACTYANFISHCYIVDKSNISSTGQPQCNMNV